MMDDNRPVTTVTKTDASVTNGTVVTAEDRIEAEAARTPTKTTTGTARRATIPTLHGAPCATGVKPPGRAVDKAPANNHASTTVLRVVVVDAMAEGNGATTGPARSTTTIGIALPATTPISPSDNRATDAMHPAPEGAPTTVDRKATATAEGTAEAEETGSLEAGATTATVVAPTEVSNATEDGPTALVAMNVRVATLEIDKVEATAITEAVSGGTSTGDHNSNAPRVRVTAERVGSVRAMRTTVSPGISGTDLVGSVEAMTIDRGAAA